MNSKVFIASVGCLLLGFLTVSAQDPATATNGSAGIPAVVITAESSPTDLAKAAIEAQGGQKFRDVKNIQLRGSVQLYAPNSIQSIPANSRLLLPGIN